MCLSDLQMNVSQILSEDFKTVKYDLFDYAVSTDYYCIFFFVFRVYAKVGSLNHIGRDWRSMKPLLCL